MSALPPTTAPDPSRPRRHPADALYWTAFAVIFLVTVAADPTSIPEGPAPGAVVGPDSFAAAYVEPARPEPALEATDPACIVWTSGTTGEPKGAVYDHARLAAISRNMGELTADGDRRLVSLPFAHVGYMTRIYDEIASGTTLVLSTEPWSAGEHLRLLEAERITMITGVPTQWSLVLAHPDMATTDCSSLRLAGIGAEVVANSPEEYLATTRAEIPRWGRVVKSSGATVD